MDGLVRLEGPVRHGKKPMKRILGRAVIAAVVIACMGVTPLHAAIDPMGDSLKVIREAGTALFSWWVDYTHADSGPPQDLSTFPETYDWLNCPVITFDEARSQLVPFYIADLPRKDAWGNDLEFCLEWEDRESVRFVVGVLSPGRDGKFSDAPYARGAYSSLDLDRDILWLDGLFYSWPEPPPKPIR